MKKLSIGVIIFGVLFILSGLKGIGLLLNVQQTISLMGPAWFVLSLIGSALAFLSGIYLLIRDVNARTIVFTLVAVNLLTASFYGPALQKAVTSKEAMARE